MNLFHSKTKLFTFKYLQQRTTRSLLFFISFTLRLRREIMRLAVEQQNLARAYLPRRRDHDRFWQKRVFSQRAVAFPFILFPGCFFADANRLAELVGYVDRL